MMDKQSNTLSKLNNPRLVPHARGKSERLNSQPRADSVQDNGPVVFWIGRPSLELGPAVRFHKSLARKAFELPVVAFEVAFQ